MGTCSSGKGRSVSDAWEHKTRLNLYRDWGKNSKTVMNMFDMANSIIYYKKYNTVEFFSHERSIGEVKNKDNMNIRQLAKNYNKIYNEV